MFNKLKQFKDLRSQAKTMQNALADESVTVEKGGISIKMDGNMKVINVKITEEKSKEKLEESIKDSVNSAIKKTQRLMAEKMQKMGGIPGFGQ